MNTPLNEPHPINLNANRPSIPVNTGNERNNTMDRLTTLLARRALVCALLVLVGMAVLAPAQGRAQDAGRGATSAAPEGVAASLASGRLDAQVLATLHTTGSAEALLVLRRVAVDAALEDQGAGPEFMGTAPVLDPAAEDAGSGPVGDQGPAVSFETWLAERAGALTAVKQWVAGAMPAGFSVVQDYDNLPVQLVRFDNLEALSAALAHPAVALVDENRLVEPTLGQSLPLIGAPAARAAGYTGAGRSVAVLDTGADFTRAAFGSCTAPGVPAGCRVTVARDFAPEDNQRDDHGHGTNVAGIALGVAPQANILALDVFHRADFDGDGTLELRSTQANQIAALNWVITNRNAHNIVATNMSLGNGAHHTAACQGAALGPVFANLRAAGVLPIVSAGNSAAVDGAFQNGISFPACVPGAVSVGAVYDADVGRRNWGACTDATSAADRITCFSQSGPTLSLLAPGALINAAGITMSGTSQAAPHVAGAVAALASRCTNPTVARIEGAITGNGPQVTDARNGVTVRRLDLAAASAACPNVPAVIVPDVVGERAADALRTLQSARFSVSVRNVVDHVCNDIGAVIRQDPRGGTASTAGATVTIWVGTRPSHPCP